MFKFFTPVYQQTKLNQWINIVSVSFLLITIIRVLEWNLILSYHTISSALPIWELAGLFHDYFAVTVMLVCFGILQRLFFFVNIRIARFIVLAIVLSLFLFQLLLVFYFNESLTPLSVSDIYGMSQSQVEFISEIYGFKMVYLFSIVPIVILLMFVVNVLARVVNFKLIKVFSIGLMVLSVGKMVVKPVSQNTYDSELNFHIVSNKVYYFASSWFTYQNDQLMNSDEFVPNTEFPFYHQKEDKDVLSPFFSESETAPNIVFIISESLGKQYSGKDARLGSFTPFLDSLAEHSLYWQNMVANAERTFGAIPNLMTGLPEGERGFMNLIWNMPDHLSLPLVLKEQNNYQTGFYCGAWKHFDNMAEYVRFQKFDHVLGKIDFLPNLIDHVDIPGEKQYEMKNWGAEDYEVFQQSVEFIAENYDSLSPFFNLYLSTSFHKPYAFTNQTKFDKKALDIISRTVENEEQENYRKQLSDFGTILYADYSMQQLFEMYKKADLFENTIFIICGDHSLKFMSDNSRLEKFHVPLLIYSPLLTRSKSIKSVISQKDVPSGLQALLKNTFNLNLPKFSISQNNGLDTLESLSFCDDDFVMMYTNKRLTNYVEKDVLLSDNMLFKIGKNLSVNKFKNDRQLKELQSKLLNYNLHSNYVCSSNKLLPQSVLEKFSSFNYQLNFFNDFSFSQIKNFKSDSLCNKIYYSKPKSVKVISRKFISLLTDQRIHLSTRVRVIIKFKLLSPSGDLPQLIIAHTNPEIKDKIFYLKLNGNSLKETSKDGWLNVETAYWIERGDDDVINAYLFNPDIETLYLDDLLIEIRDF